MGTSNGIKTKGLKEWKQNSWEGKCLDTKTSLNVFLHPKKVKQKFQVSFLFDSNIILDYQKPRL